ncbi:proteasome accessory factor PafA2 family protein [Patescibacteria group bacterium]|nr:proteasome accessory factor PafA2 family protein [Patescibacteria group bacterium]
MNRRIYGTEVEYGMLKKDKSGWCDDTKIPEEIFLGFIENGARIYHDMRHVEYATPECSSPEQAVAAEIAGGRLLTKLVYGLKDSKRVVFIKESIGFDAELISAGPFADGRKRYAYGHDYIVSFACHENYSLDPRKISGLLGIKFTEKQWDYLARKLAPFLITRQIVAGSGTFVFGPFYLSSRAPFICKLSNPSATANTRSVINTKEEPLGNVPRLHIVIGESNMAEIANFLKLGTMGLVLSLMEDGLIQGSRLQLASVEEAASLIGEIAKDTSCTTRIIPMESNEKISAHELQKRFYQLACSHYPKDEESDAVKQRTEKILYWWGYVLQCIESGDISKLVGIIDWPTKMELGRSLLKKYDIRLEDLPAGIRNRVKREEIAMNLRALEQRYHELSDESYYEHLRKKKIMRSIISDKAIKRLMYFPPRTTRAYGRGSLIRWLKEHPDRVSSASIQWDSINLRLKLRDGTTDKRRQIKMDSPFVPMTMDVKRILKYNR